MDKLNQVLDVFKWMKTLQFDHLKKCCHIVSTQRMNQIKGDQKLHHISISLFDSRMWAEKGNKQWHTLMSSIKALILFRRKNHQISVNPFRNNSIFKVTSIFWKMYSNFPAVNLVVPRTLTRQVATNQFCLFCWENGFEMNSH